MEAGVFFEVAHLLELVSQGRWGPAHRYLRCFSALWGHDDGAATQYAALLHSLAHNSKLAWFACRGDEGGRAASLRKPPLHLYREAYPEIAEREAMYCSMASQQARESVDWNDIKLGTLERAKELLRLRPNSQPGTPAVESIAAAHAHASRHSSSRLPGLSEASKEESRP